MTKVNQKIKNALLAEASPEKAISMQRFFKTGKGEYGEGDKFHGVSVPSQRKIAKDFQESCGKEDIIELLDSAYHEERLTAVFILVYKFNKSIRNKSEKEWVDLYVEKAERMNNWDLVDSSAHLILGKWLENRDKDILYKFAQSGSLWKNRIAVVSQLHFIRKNDFSDLFPLCEIMLKHKHDLMHKASGWMLREAWNKAPSMVEEFLDKHKADMPRTMLRYAIEKMIEEKRMLFLKK